ncbi:hypothetical protein FQN54_007207 [Arachnomyces sp. PD_36]|nr:hypothetical protein FQN54_007207 [Arachnomyces sp. PD_36]
MPYPPKRPEKSYYEHHVTTFIHRDDRAHWKIGSKFVLKERDKYSGEFEAENLRFVKENTSIPVPTVVEEWKEDGGHYFLLTKSTPGTPLKAVWPTMTDDEKNKVAKQTADYMLQLRELQGPGIHSLRGEPLGDTDLFGGKATGVSISSDDELWTEMEKLLINYLNIPKQIRQKIREKMPPAAPYTFTNQGLFIHNVLVKDGNVVGISDWESGGYCPVWWETAACLSCFDLKDEKEWSKLLLKHMPRHDDAVEFIADYFECFLPPERRGKRWSRLVANLD